jgi:formylglycine-generating enzyme required for sulfatase activity
MFAGKGNINDMGWHHGNSEGRLHAVATREPNAWGIYDMHGNAAEWCLDGYDHIYAGTMSDAILDPLVTSNALRRVVRGGDYVLTSAGCRSAARDSNHPDRPRPNVGFRVVLDDDDSPPDRAPNH